MSTRSARSARRLLVAALVACAALVLAGAAANSGSQAAGNGRATLATEFPPGPGREIASRSCLICHSASLVVQQAKDSTAWEKTIGQMEKWGVKLTPAEHDTLRGYLVTRLGPRARAVARPR